METQTEEPPGVAQVCGTLRDKIWEVFKPTQAQWNDWKWHFRNRMNTVDKLARVMPLTEAQKAQLQLVSHKYPFSITPYYLSLVHANDPQDPILLQSLPSYEELLYSEVGEEDPLDERDDSPAIGVVHRYPDRALFVITDICPLLCRHCTRKREWDGENWWFRRKEELEAAIDYLRKTSAIREVIISGGDPLTMDNNGLEWILSRLRAIPHMEIIRFGTRFPVVLPQRIDEGFCRLCDKYGPIWLNTHFNHPNEITTEAAQCVRELLRAGVPVNNQSVLLRGINDSVAVQTKLAHELMKIRVRPYYLFHADEVRGTEHLRTPIETGLKIIEGMRGHTSGLAIPTFVVDVPGGGGKIPLQPNYVLSWTEDEMVLRNYEGLIFRYRNPRPGAPGKGNGSSRGHIPAKEANGHASPPAPLKHQPASLPAPRELVGATAGGGSPRLERRRLKLLNQAEEHLQG